MALITTPIERLNDFVNGTASDADAVDSELNQLVLSVNNLIKDIQEGLASIVDSDSGADKIGSTAIAGVTGLTVQAQLEDLKSQINGIISITIPDGSLGIEKLNFDPATQLELDTLKGSGHTTETVKQNADDISGLDIDFSNHVSDTSQHTDIMSTVGDIIQFGTEPEVLSIGTLYQVAYVDITGKLAYGDTPKKLMTTKGDLLIATAPYTMASLPIGTEGQVLKVGSGGLPEYGENLSGIKIIGGAEFSTSLPASTTITYNIPLGVNAKYVFMEFFGPSGGLNNSLWARVFINQTSNAVVNKSNPFSGIDFTTYTGITPVPISNITGANNGTSDSIQLSSSAFFDIKVLTAVVDGTNLKLEIINYEVASTQLDFNYKLEVYY